MSQNENRLINGKKVKERILSRVKEYVQFHSKKRNLGKLVSIHLGDTPEIELYIRNQKRAAEGATVTVCHHMTRSVAMHSRRADAVIVAVGKPKFLGSEMIKPGAAVIDIGINQIKDEVGNLKIVGDCDTEAILEIAGWVTPVPGGVGPVTVAMLMDNAIKAHKRQVKIGWLK